MKTVNIKHLYGSVDSSILTLRGLSPHLQEFLRRREHEATDGFPSSSMGGGTHNGTVSDPTLRAAMQKPQSDPVATAIDTILKSIGEIDTLCRTIANAQSQVLSIEENERGRHSSVNECSACAETVTMVGEDRLWSSLDRKCFDRSRAWRRKQADAGKDSSLEAFRRMVKQEMDDIKRKKPVRV